MIYGLMMKINKEYILWYEVKRGGNMIKNNGNQYPPGFENSRIAREIYDIIKKTCFCK